MRVWHSIVPTAWPAWNAISLGIFMRGVRNPGRCPICGGASLRFFFQRYGESRAGFWMWCPACLRYEHASCRAPSWWRDVPAGPLEHNPNWLEEHWDDLEPVLRAAGDLL